MNFKWVLQPRVEHSRRCTPQPRPWPGPSQMVFTLLQKMMLQIYRWRNASAADADSEKAMEETVHTKKEYGMAEWNVTRVYYNGTRLSSSSTKALILDVVIWNAIVGDHLATLLFSTDHACRWIRSNGILNRYWNSAGLFYKRNNAKWSRSRAQTVRRKT